MISKFPHNKYLNTTKGSKKILQIGYHYLSGRNSVNNIRNKVKMNGIMSISFYHIDSHNSNLCSL